MNAPTVFIVEDDPDTREMLSRFLEMEGYRIESAGNGQEALDRFAEGAEADVILLDLMMPVMDGWQFRTRQVEDSRLCKIPTIVVSASGRDLMAQISADAYVAKPIDDLLTRVAQFCAV
ncbi:MAG TPA: response regulator [Vicinamibacterales bacterium]|nr:response regulator [Vicinamibacterales bacterium]